jgi:hypothetical protein
MEYTINLTLDRAYFSEAFSQSIRYANRWRKAERTIGTIFILLGVAFLAWFESLVALPIVLIALGVIELIFPILKKPWWVGRQMKSKVANGTVEIVLSESGIHTSGPYSKGEMTWEGVERILETPRGVFIWPQKGMHIYLPKSVVGNEAVRYVLSRSV